MLCEDLDLPQSKFVQLIAESIRAQVLDFESFQEVKLPPGSTRVVINVSSMHSLMVQIMILRCG